MSENIIIANGLSKHYGQQKALDKVSFKIGRGQIVGLLGPNGAGKTTLIKSLLGLCAYEGELSMMGAQPRIERKKLMQQVSFIADVATLPGWMKVNQALDFVEGVHPRFDREKANTFLAHTEIPMNAKIKTLSKGMVVQLHLAVVMAIDATVLVLDEPTLGLDILYRKHFYRQLLNDFFDKDRTIIVTSHQIDEIEHILSHVMMIKHGKLLLHEDIEHLKTQFCYLTVPQSKAELARKLKPISETKRLGEVQFLFERPDKTKLVKLGECSAVPISDIFVAKMGVAV